MFLSIIEFIKQLFFFTGSYSNNLFLEPLTKEEEEKYLELLKNGNEDARNKLIEHNLRLVAHIVKKFNDDSHQQDDLISIGTIGLIKGIDTYKEGKNVRLTTYCARCIQNEILMYYRSNNKYSKNISINEGIGFDKDGNEITILDILKSDKPDFALELYEKENIKLLSKYFHVLNSREKEILTYRYGLGETDELTQKEIAKKLHISRSYVSRIEKRALTKLLKEFIVNKKN
ncbi:MAG: RNA polymerase sporulation sigma factor SigK [Bacilli bacterium]|nr:RNA polymerase sporulation sigma factor SigK [Bacilli bacterium]